MSLGRLALVNRVTVTSQVSNVTLTGIDDDSVYVVTFNDVFIGGAQDFLYMRVTKSGTADTTSNYDNAGELHRGAGNNDKSATNQTWWLTWLQGTSSTSTTRLNGVIQLHNFNSATQYSYVTMEAVNWIATQTLEGTTFGMTHTVASASDGVWFDFNSGNVQSGVFSLYKVLGS